MNISSNLCAVIEKLIQIKESRKWLYNLFGSYLTKEMEDIRNKIE